MQRSKRQQRQARAIEQLKNELGIWDHLQCVRPCPEHEKMCAKKAEHLENTRKNMEQGK